MDRLQQLRLHDPAVSTRLRCFGPTALKPKRFFAADLTVIQYGPRPL
jgi:hypothetical protein